MDRDLHDMFGPASRHRLTVAEKESIHRALTLARQKSSPFSVVVTVVRIVSRSLSGWAPLVASVIVLVVGGASFTLAQSSLPGDFLYPLKRVNESVQTNLNFSTESKAAVAETHLTTRLDEADRLEVRGTLTENTTNQLDQAYRLERREVTKNIADLEAQGKTIVAAQIRARLNAAEDRYKRLFKGTRRDLHPAARDAGDYPSVKSSSSLSTATDGE